jgi:hypothetical protein
MGNTQFDCFDVKIFKDQEKAKVFSCPICTQIMHKVTQCKNGHCFGRKCLENALKNSKRCPQCRVDLREESIIPNIFVDNQVSELEAYCIHKEMGCNWENKLDSLDNHLKKECMLEEEKCANSGCDKFIKRKFKGIHWSKCPFSLVNCELCGLLMKRREIEVH